MNIFDYVVMGGIAAGAIYGIREGLLRMATSLVSLGVGIYVASVYYGHAGGFAAREFGAGQPAASVIGWVIVFLLVFVAIQIAGSSAINLLNAVHMGWADRLAGSALGAGMVAIAAGMAVTLLAAVLPPTSTILRNSELAPMLISYNDMLVRYLPPEARDAYEAHRDALVHSWVVEQAAKAVGRTDASPQPSP
jgi:membrane protein required for colicin V production